MSLKSFSMFDGVGGFVIGLNNANKAIQNDYFKTLYSNQFEPSRKSQDAYEVGYYRFNDMEHIPHDIMTVPNSKFKEMKDQGVNLILGGFPCQDYSVARSLKNEQGISGKKGVLFWEIIRAVKIIEPKYLILENVDRLLKSPSKQRGRDFAIMLGAFNKLGYSVEWRVINAAEYGRAQRRRRVFFFVYKNDTDWAKIVDKKFESNINEGNLNEIIQDDSQYDNYIFKEGLFARQFPVQCELKFDGKKARKSAHFLGTDTDYDSYILNISDNFTGTVWNTGIMRHGKYFSIDTIPVVEEPLTLGDIVKTAKNAFLDNHSDKEKGLAEYHKYINKYIITDEEKLKKFEHLRGAKKIPRKKPDGTDYFFSEGAMSPFDSLELPARTMLTSEGTTNRSTHLLFENNYYRLLTPIEAELLQDFPADWTKYKQNEHTKEITEVSDRMRYFFMGNALVTGIVKRIGIELYNIDKSS